MQKYEYVRVMVTTPDGELLDEFPVCHWKAECSFDGKEEENVGSPAANNLLVERIAQYVKTLHRT